MREIFFPSPPGEHRAFRTALHAVVLFAVVHVTMCCLQMRVLPMSPPFNFLWLGIEAFFGAAAVLVFLGCLIRSSGRGRASMADFRDLFRDVRTLSAVLLLVWVVWAVIACLLAAAEERTSVYHNVRYLYYQAAEMLVLFPLGLYFGRREKMGLLHLVFDLCLAIFVLQLLYGLMRFCLGEVSFTVWEHTYDFSSARARLGDNANLIGAYSALFLIGGIYRFGTLKTAGRKALLVLAEIVVFIAFAMAESRSAIVASALSVGVFAGAAFFRRSRRGVAVRVLGGLVCAAAGSALFLLVYYGARALILDAQAGIYGRAVARAAAEQPVRAAAGSRFHPVMLSAGSSLDGEGARDLIGGSKSPLNGRLRIWRAVIRNIASDRHMLLHGCSMASTGYWVETLIKKPFRTHNQFLEVLVAQGLPALCLFVAWLVPVAGKSVSLGLRGRRGSSWRLALPLLTMIVNNMAEAMLVGRMHLPSCFFFLIAGYVCALPRGERQT